MNKGTLNWGIFILLSLIWGSSFILMKEGLAHLTAYQVASLRIVFSGIVLLPTALKNIKNIPKNKLGIIFLSGLLGSLLPAYFFCIAEKGLDSSLVGSLNSLTPIFVIITGALIFKTKANKNKIIGIIVSFIGSILLLLCKSNNFENQNILFIVFVLFATICYGINVNMVQQHLSNIGSLNIAAIALTLNAIPALIVLISTGYFNLPLNNLDVLKSTGAAALLGILGTAIASIIFYILVKRAGAIFAAMVTYGIPVVAIIWGIIYKEQVTWKQVACLFIILFGVYVANIKTKTT